MLGAKKLFCSAEDGDQILNFISGLCAMQPVMMLMVCRCLFGYLEVLLLLLTAVLNLIYGVCLLLSLMQASITI